MKAKISIYSHGKLKQLFCYILLLCLCAGCREQIVHNVSEYEANRLLSSLQDMAIDAAKEHQADGSWAISVPNADSLRAIKFVSDSRMVREPVSAVAGKSSLVMSRDEQRFAYERSLSREIETTLLSIPGVLEARVHLNMPANDPLLDRRMDDAKGSGSVLLLVESQRLVPREEIATLVAGASGVPVTAVSVVVAEDPRSVVPQAGEIMHGNPNQAASQNLFAPDPQLNPRDVETSITLVQAPQNASSGIWKDTMEYIGNWIKNFSAPRFLIVSALVALLIGLYWYARRLQRGTGLCPLA